MKRIEIPVLPGPIQRVYDALPSIQCKGLCYRTCGPIIMSGVERERMAAARGVRGEMFLDGKGHCPMLDPRTHRCRVHAVRPLICRLYGVSVGLECHWGCVPDGGEYVTRKEAGAMIDAVEEAGGGLDCFRPGKLLRVERK
jgi:Fe-S-cluster containining protein